MRLQESFESNSRNVAGLGEAKTTSNTDTPTSQAQYILYLNLFLSLKFGCKDFHTLRTKVEATLKSAWTEKDQIENLLKERRLMRSLEKFVGGRLYEGDLRLRQKNHMMFSSFRKLKKGVEDFRYSEYCTFFSKCRSVKIKDFQRKDATLKLPKVHDGERRLCLVDDLKMLKITMSNTSSRNKLNPEVNDHYNIFSRESQEYELKTKDEA
ncbi:hypothetical protein Tco_0256062 [Tanacetum coccineum]